MDSKNSPSSEVKYLLDECITIHWPFNLGKPHDDCISSVDIIGHGAKDEEVLNLALKLKRVLVTSDMKFTLKILLKNQPVYFQKMDGERYFIKPTIEKLENVGRCDDHLAQFLLCQERIIVP